MNTSLFLFVFAGYVIFMIALSWWVSRTQSSGQDFLLGGRNVAGFLTLGTTIATMVGTGSSMGAVGFAYTNGWAGTLYGIGGSIGILVLAWLYAPVRRLKFVTMSEELAYYVGADPTVKGVVAILIFVASVGWLGAHIIGGALYLGWITGIDLNVAKAVVAAAFGIYVIVGGYVAVVWTDTIQAVVLFVGFVLMAVFAIHIVGGWDALVAAQPESNRGFLSVEKVGLIPAVSLSTAIFIGIMATPSYRQRIYSGRSVLTVRRSFVMAGSLYLVFSVIPAIIGMAAFALEPALEQPPFAFPFLAVTVLPVSIGIIVLVAGLSATMSSASSDAVAAVTILLRDLSGPFANSVTSTWNVITNSRIGLAFIIIAALSLALLSNDILEYITAMISTVMSGLFVCALLGKYWPRFNRFGALAALVAGVVVSLTVISSQTWTSIFGNPILPAVFGALFAGVVISLLTPPSTIGPADAIKILEQQRTWIESS